MKIEHIAIWTTQLEPLKDFYIKYFGATANHMYHNPTTKFTSYFLAFDEGSRLELMAMDSVSETKGEAYDQFIGLAHFSMSLGSEQAVDELTARLVADGYEKLDGPRRTGDGYWESCVLDPDGNRIELTV
ncbi:glyoxalase [Vibrio tubiashii]|nr:glyoxalase [Vibrio tubiashii]